jgi:PEP-CTERM motif
LLIPCDLNPSLTDQYLDAYGVLLSYNGYEAEIYGNGPFGPPGDYYTFATRDNANYGENDYLSSNNADTFAVSAAEPATWAMMLLGFAGLGFAALRKSKHAVTADA